MTETDDIGSIIVEPDQDVPPDDDMQDQVGWSWSGWRVKLLLANALLGLILFEWAWAHTSRFRKSILEFDDMMPGFRRDDAKQWSKWALYPGAMTIMLPRFLLGVSLAALH